MAFQEILDSMLEVSEDKTQAYAAALLHAELKRTCYKIEDLKYKYDSGLKLIVLEGIAKEFFKVFVPVPFTISMTPRWIRKIDQHFGEINPNASVILALISSDGVIVMDETLNGLCLPRKVSKEDLRKSHNSDEHSSEET